MFFMRLWLIKYFSLGKKSFVCYRVVEVRRGGRIAIRRDQSIKVNEYHACTLARNTNIMRFFDRVDVMKIEKIAQLSLSSRGRMK